jgi:CRP/FNR family transcriptional regulator, cyclic AMP receptor protein
LFKKVDNQKYGPVLAKPNPQLYDDAANFVRKVIRNGMDDFVGAKYYLWMSALVRVKKKLPAGDKFQPLIIIDLMQKEVGRNNGDAALAEMIRCGVVRELPGKEFITFNPVTIQKRIIFENLYRLLKNIQD